MAIFKGLEIRLEEVAEDNNTTSTSLCEEYTNISCDGGQESKNYYLFVCLRPGRAFIIRAKVLDKFDWADSDALRLNIDFDACTEVKNAEIILVRLRQNTFKSVLPLTRGSTNSPLTASVSRLTQLVVTQHVLPHKEEEVSFGTLLLSDESGNPRTKIDRHGEIWIAVERCKLEKRDHQSRRAKERGMASRPTMQKLREAGIFSKIE